MSLRNRQDPLTRARSTEDKVKVREAFIDAGRRLLAQGDPASVSLRRIAAEAGYAPGSIYQYFSNQQELLWHVRAHEMDAATEALVRAIAKTRDPAKRVIKLFLASADYWLEHIDHFLLIFPMPSTLPLQAGPDGIVFAQTPEVQMSLKLFYDTVEEFFATLEKPPMPPRLAAHTLMAAVHGAIVFPHMARSMEWSDIREMVRALVTTVVESWARAQSGK